MSLWHHQWLGSFPHQALPGLDPEIQLQLAIDAVNPLVVPAKALDVAQIEKTQAETPCLPGRRQAQQPVGNLLVLTVELASITIARLAYPERPAGERHADGVVLNGLHGHLLIPKAPDADAWGL